MSKSILDAAKPNKPYYFTTDWQFIMHMRAKRAREAKEAQRQALLSVYSPAHRMKGGK